MGGELCLGADPLVGKLLEAHHIGPDALAGRSLFQHVHHEGVLGKRVRNRPLIRWSQMKNVAEAR